MAKSLYKRNKNRKHHRKNCKLYFNLNSFKLSKSESINDLINYGRNKTKVHIRPRYRYDIWCDYRWIRYKKKNQIIKDITKDILEDYEL